MESFFCFSLFVKILSILTPHAPKSGGVRTKGWDRLRQITIKDIDALAVLPKKL